MKTKKMYLCLTILLAGCTQYAFGLYNPSVGRWLNRDPLPSSEVYTFVRNRGNSLVDYLGLEACEILDPTTVPADDPYFKIYPNAAGFTSYNWKRYQFPWHPCCKSNGKSGRALNPDVLLTVQVKYKVGKDPDNTFDCLGLSARDHESGHVSIYCDWANSVDGHARAYSGHCYSEKCASAIESEISKYNSYQHKYTNWRQSAYDCEHNDCRNPNGRFCTQADTDYNEQTAAFKEYEAAVTRVESDCKSE